MKYYIGSFNKVSIKCVFISKDIQNFSNISSNYNYFWKFSWLSSIKKKAPRFTTDHFNF